MNHPHKFSIHYTRDEARKLLPQIDVWLAKLLLLEDQLKKASHRVEQLIASGQDHGGPKVEAYLKLQGEFLELLGKFQEREIMIKDLHRGLIDFPAIVDGREVFLCWEQGEEDIEFWHELDGGYAGRERL